MVTAATENDCVPSNWAVYRDKDNQSPVNYTTSRRSGGHTGSVSPATTFTMNKDKVLHKSRLDQITQEIINLHESVQYAIPQQYIQPVISSRYVSHPPEVVDSNPQHENE